MALSFFSLLCHSFFISSPLDSYSEKCDSSYFSAFPCKNTPLSLSSNVKIFRGELWHSPVRYVLLALLLWAVMWETKIGLFGIKSAALDQLLCLGRWDLKYCFQNKTGSYYDLYALPSDFLLDLQLCPHLCPFFDYIECASGSTFLPLLFHRNAFFPDACVIKFPTTFRPQFTCHLPERLSLTTLSKTVLPIHLLCNFSCLFLRNICYFLTL